MFCVSAVRNGTVTEIQERWNSYVFNLDNVFWFKDLFLKIGLQTDNLFFLIDTNGLDVFCLKMHSYQVIFKNFLASYKCSR